MANQITPLNYANTFGDWVVTTNSVVAETNDIGANNYTKSNGTFFINSSGTGLQVANNAIVQGILSVSGIGSSAVVQNQLSVQGQIYASNTQAGVTALKVDGMANVANLNITGAGVSLNVANVSVLSGAVGMGSTLTVSSNARVAGVNANSHITTVSLYSTTSYSTTLTANGQFNAGSANIIGQLDGSAARIGNIIANTSLVGGTITANTVLSGGSANVIGVVDAGSARISNIIANTSLIGGTITANTVLSGGSANVIGIVDAGSARIDNIIANTSLVGGTITANTILSGGSANVIGVIDAGSARIDNIIANTSMIGGTITANTVLSGGSANIINAINASSANIVNTMQANTGNVGTLSAVTTVIGGTITANAALNGGNLNVASYGRIATTLNVNAVSANSYINTATIYADSINTNNIFANTSIIAGKDLTVKGNFVIDGGTIYNSNEFDLYGATPITASQSGRFGVNRGESTNPTFTPNAYIQFENSDKQWKIRGIHGATGAEQNTYYTIVTEKYTANLTNAGIVQLSNSNTSASITQALSLAGAQSLSNFITNTAAGANNVMLANVATINGSITANVATINGSIANNAVSANSVINTNISANVATINASIKANADIKVSTFTITVPTGLTGTVGGTVTNNTYAISLTSGYSIPTTSSQTNWDTAYTDRNKWDGGSSGLVAANGRTSLGGTTVGSNLFTLTDPGAIRFLRVNADNTVSALSDADFRTAIGSSVGSVTSVGISVPTGLSVANTPVTSTGTIAISLTSGYSIPTNSSQTNWDTAYTDRNKWDGGSSGLVAANGRTSLGGTTVGQNFFTLTNPGAITFPRMNADNTVSALNAADFRTAVGVPSLTDSVSTTSSTVGASATAVKTAYDLAATKVTSNTQPYFTGIYLSNPSSYAPVFMYGTSGPYYSYIYNAGSLSNMTINFANQTTGALGNFDNSGNFTATGTVTATSDRRLKSNIKTIENALEKTLKLRGVTYEKAGANGIGLIAQEIQEIFPEVVLEGGDENKTLSVAYGNIVGVLIEAIKELKAEIDELKKK